MILVCNTAIANNHRIYKIIVQNANIILIRIYKSANKIH